MDYRDTRRSTARNVDSRRSRRAASTGRGVPELSRHLRGGDVYRPDPSAALPPPRLTRWFESEPADSVPEEKDERVSERVPPFARRPRRSAPAIPLAVRIGGVVIVAIVLIAAGIERLPPLSGQNAAPSPTPGEAVPAVAELPQASPIATATITPTPEPTATPTPTLTPTPNPRYVGKVVCLDPGHGGSDRGFVRQATENAPAMEEAHYNLAFARALKIRLEQHGFTVVMTRTTDTDVNASGRDVNGDGKTRANASSREEGERAAAIDELQARINVCNEAKADLLVSMHINGFDDPNVSGYETWFSSARSFSHLNKLFATIAFEELGKQMAAAGYNATPRRVFDDVEADVNRGNEVFDRYVITGPAVPGLIVPSAMPGAIVEVLFISNDADAAFLASSEGRNAIVTAYERAIMRYFDETSGESSEGTPSE